MKSSPSSHLLFRLTLLSMKEILYRFQAFNLFCFVFVFFNFRSHSPLPFFFSRTRVCISIFYVMKIVYLSSFSGMREIRNSSDLSTLNWQLLYLLLCNKWFVKLFFEISFLSYSECVECLLEHNAKVLVYDKITKSTPLHAAGNFHVDLFTLPFPPLG